MSRRFHFWNADTEDVEHAYEGLIRNFEYLGCVTEDVIVANQKAAVLTHQPGEEPRFNELPGSGPSLQVHSEGVEGGTSFSALVKLLQGACPTSEKREKLACAHPPSLWPRSSLYGGRVK